MATGEKMSKKLWLFSGKSVVGLAFLLLTISAIACSSAQFFPTATPYPTFTPYPTLAPYPTYTPNPPTMTPVPENWSVKVMSAIKSRTFGEWFYEESVNGEYVIITIEYTYLGRETTGFSPQSVVLLFPDDSSWPGYALAATDYQSENNNKVMNFFNQGPILTYIKPGQTKIEKFGWGLTVSTDTKYRLLFPETKPIDITIEK
jgi:hypothetical protein